MYFAEEPIIGGAQQEVYAATVVDSGTCGYNLTWTLDDEGTLTISGKGAIDNYAWGNYAPWYSYKGSIKNLVIGDSVTGIGGWAFDDCSSLADVYYFGEQTDWDKINIGNGNKYLTDARIHFVVTVSIAEQPVNASALNGETVKVTVKTQGDGVTYQWYIKNKGASKYSKSSITSNTYSAVMDESRDGRILRCVIKDKYGNLIRSDIVTISMS